MLIATLTFADKTKAPALLEAHNAWIQRGFADGVFLLTGSLQPNGGGAILAHQTSRAEFEARLRDDPFVAEGVSRSTSLKWPPVGWMTVWHS